VEGVFEECPNDVTGEEAEHGFDQCLGGGYRERREREREELTGGD
jgi:hypothetical protein